MNIGWMYQAGKGVKKSLKLAIHHLEIARGLGAEEANYYLGMALRENGDFSHALECLTKCVDTNPSAMYWAGSMYLHGEGITRDPVRAKELLERAAKAGHAFAKRDLALGRIRGSFGKREVLGGVWAWVKAVSAGIGSISKDANSHQVN